MTEYLKFDENKGHFLDVHAMRDFYIHYAYKIEKKDNPNMEFMIAQILYTLMFGALSYVTVLTVLALFGEYLPLSIEIFFEEFFISLSIFVITFSPFYIYFIINKSRFIFYINQSQLDNIFFLAYPTSTN